MSTQAAYQIAKEQYAKIGVDTDAVLERLKQIKVSIHCWQGDDIAGFLFQDNALTGGIQVTGNYPGRACRTLKRRFPVSPEHINLTSTLSMRTLMKK